MKKQKTLSERIAQADMYASRWLGRGNFFEERGNREAAEKCFQKSQFWLDRWNKLTKQN